MQRAWTILTGEYPPDNGGVSDYTRIVAENLIAAGDTVDIWAPTSAASKQPGHASEIRVHRLPDHFGPRSIAWMNKRVDILAAGNQILVQYVPHAFGYKAMNLPFCHWLFELGRRREVWTMFHEVAYPLAWNQPLRHNALGNVNKLMAMMVARASRRIFVTIPAWANLLRPLVRPGQTFEWMPIPSNVATEIPSTDVARVRTGCKLLDDDLLIGHFGTYSPLISDMLRELMLALLSKPRRHALFLGRGGIEFVAALAANYPDLAGRLHAPGGLSAERVAAHLSACDLLLQSYPDGVSCRRGSMMAGLALGCPIVTNLGHCSEPFWQQSGAVALAERPDADAIAETAEQLLANPTNRFDFAARARRLYMDKFDVRWTIEALRSEPPSVAKPDQWHERERDFISRHRSAHSVYRKVASDAAQRPSLG